MLRPVAVDVSTGERIASRDVTSIVLDPDYTIGEIADDPCLDRVYFWKIWSVINYTTPEELLHIMQAIGYNVHSPGTST